MPKRRQKPPLSTHFQHLQSRMRKKKKGGGGREKNKRFVPITISLAGEDEDEIKLFKHKEKCQNQKLLISGTETEKKIAVGPEYMVISFLKRSCPSFFFFGGSKHRVGSLRSNRKGARRSKCQLDPYW